MPVASLVLALSLASPSQAADPALHAALEKAARGSGGVAGVGVVHVESGRQAFLFGGERFPMASVFKLPIALHVLRRIDEGKESLDRKVAVSEADLRLGVEDRPELAGRSLTIRELLESMLVDSDNTACDLLLREAGGPKAVEARLRELGVDGIDVSWSELEMGAVWTGIAIPPEAQRSLETLRALARRVPPKDRKAAALRFEGDVRNTAMPVAAAALLVKIWRGEALKPGTNGVLLDMMRRSRTGGARLRGQLPPGTEVFDRTGTMGRTTNDVGIMTLPGGRGHVAVAVFVKSSSKRIRERERAIARIARAAYDAFAAEAVSPKSETGAGSTPQGAPAATTRW